VVAAEVRNLAQRSAAASKEIKALIGDSVDKVEAGTKLVGAAGKTMEEIVSSVRKVSDLIAEIAAASQEQSSGIEQVNRAVTQMDQVVQQNASLVEESHGGDRVDEGAGPARCCSWFPGSSWRASGRACAASGLAKSPVTATPWSNT